MVRDEGHGGQTMQGPRGHVIKIGDFVLQSRKTLRSFKERVT